VEGQVSVVKRREEGNMEEREERKKEEGTYVRHESSSLVVEAGGKLSVLDVDEDQLSSSLLDSGERSSSALTGDVGESGVSLPVGHDLRAGDSSEESSEDGEQGRTNVVAHSVRTAVECRPVRHLVFLQAETGLAERATSTKATGTYGQDLVCQPLDVFDGESLLPGNALRISRSVEEALCVGRESRGEYAMDVNAEW
jgi:hypothetical protein